MQPNRSLVESPTVAPGQPAVLHGPDPQQPWASGENGESVQPYVEGLATQSRMHANSPAPVGPPFEQRSSGLVPKQAAYAVQQLVARHARHGSLLPVSHVAGVASPRSQATDV
jgi:hypothetical protein